MFDSLDFNEHYQRVISLDNDVLELWAKTGVGPLVPVEPEAVRVLSYVEMLLTGESVSLIVERLDYPVIVDPGGQSSLAVHNLKRKAADKVSEKMGKGMVPTVAANGIVRGDGSYGFDIVGESNYGDNIKSVSGFLKGGGLFEVEVSPEPTNTYDRDALRVHKGDKTLGYIGRDTQVHIAGLLRVAAENHIRLVFKAKASKFKSRDGNKGWFVKLDYVNRAVQTTDIRV